MKLTIPQEELITSGHTACQGCGAMLAMRYALKALGPKTMISVSACCQIVITGPVTHTNLDVPMLASAFASTASFAAGIKAGLAVQGKEDINVVAWAGDGGTFDIGIQALSAAAERHEDIFYFCYDNEAYMNTGRQRSSATPYGSWTMTTPKENLKDVPKKDIVKIMAAHKIEYIATLSIAHPEDFIRKVKKAAQIKGTKFFHILSPCPSGWLSKPENTIQIARMAVRTNIFPLYEIEDGERYTINMKFKDKTPVEEYLKMQGRYGYLTEGMINQIQDEADRNWDDLLEK
ncbi:MAG: pyruvate synthase subunit beta, partial [Ruminiclostridium sp.]|nr:pyruvate synthase subunit beta [Ruminiclostridium sp.]